MEDAQYQAGIHRRIPRWFFFPWMPPRCRRSRSLQSARLPTRNRRVCEESEALQSLNILSRLFNGLGKFSSIRSSLQQQKKDSKKEDLICPVAYATRWGSHFAKLPRECKQAEPTALVRQPTGLLVEAKTSLPFQARFWVGVWYGDFLQFAIPYKWPSII